MMHEEGGKNDLEIKQLKGTNKILNERFNERRIALDETQVVLLSNPMKTKHHLT